MPDARNKGSIQKLLTTCLDIAAASHPPRFSKRSALLSTNGFDSEGGKVRELELVPGVTVLSDLARVRGKMKKLKNSRQQYSHSYLSWQVMQTPGSDGDGIRVGITQHLTSLNTLNLSA